MQSTCFKFLKELEHNRDHALTGNYVGHREPHGLAPDWRFLIYKIEGTTLILVRTDL